MLSCLEACAQLSVINPQALDTGPRLVHHLSSAPLKKFHNLDGIVGKGDFADPSPVGVRVEALARPYPANPVGIEINCFGRTGTSKELP